MAGCFTAPPNRFSLFPPSRVHLAKPCKTLQNLACTLHVAPCKSLQNLAPCKTKKYHQQAASLSRVAFLCGSLVWLSRVFIWFLPCLVCKTRIIISVIISGRFIWFLPCRDSSHSSLLPPPTLRCRGNLDATYQHQHHHKAQAGLQPAVPGYLDFLNYVS